MENEQKEDVKLGRPFRDEENPINIRQDFLINKRHKQMVLKMMKKNGIKSKGEFYRYLIEKEWQNYEMFFHEKI